MVLDRKFFDNKLVELKNLNHLLKNSPEKANEIQIEAKEIIDEVQINFGNFKWNQKLENISENEKKKQWNELNIYIEKFKDLENSINTHRFSSNLNLKKQITKNKDNEFQMNCQIEKEGDKLWDEMDAKLGIMSKKVKKNKKIVEEINNELENQRDNLLICQKEIKNSQSLLNRSKESIKFFAKHFSSDILFKILLLISFTLVLLITIIFIIKKNSQSENNIKNIDNLSKFRRLVTIVEFNN